MKETSLLSDCPKDDEELNEEGGKTTPSSPKQVRFNVSTTNDVPDRVQYNSVPHRVHEYVKVQDSSKSGSKCVTIRWILVGLVIIGLIGTGVYFLRRRDVNKDRETSDEQKDRVDIFSHRRSTVLPMENIASIVIGTVCVIGVIVLLIVTASFNQLTGLWHRLRNKSSSELVTEV